MAAPKLAEDIRDYLTDTTGLSAVYANYVPPRDSSTKNLYAVIEYEGPPSVKTHGASGSGTRLDDLRFQVVARHTSAQTARDNIHTVVNALDDLKDVTINGVEYQYIVLQMRPRVVDRMEDGTTTFGADFKAVSRRA